MCFFLSCNGFIAAMLSLNRLSVFVFVETVQDNLSKMSVQSKAAPPSADRGEELQKILLRRRDALESQHSNSEFHALYFVLPVGYDAFTNSF